MRMAKCLSEEHNVYIMDFPFSKVPVDQSEDLKRYLPEVKCKYMAGQLDFRAALCQASGRAARM